MDEVRAIEIMDQIDMIDDIAELRRIRIHVHNKEKRLKAPKSEVAPISKFNMFDRQVAVAMDAMITRNFPNMKVRSGKEIDGWAEDIRKIREIDKFEESTIFTTVQYALKDPFWKKNILSGAKLRKQMNTLIAQQASPDRSLI